MGYTDRQIDRWTDVYLPSPGSEGNRHKLFGHSVGRTHLSPRSSSELGQKHPVQISTIKMTTGKMCLLHKFTVIVHSTCTHYNANRESVGKNGRWYRPCTHWRVQARGVLVRVPHAGGQLLPQKLNSVSPGQVLHSSPQSVGANRIGQ